MVAHATTSPLPLLSPEDKRLLRIYFRTGQSIQALADELISIQAIERSNSENSALGTQHSALPDEFDLATWATSGPIAPHIAYRKQELADARREEALKELTSLVKHSGDALERRRAATTLLRMLSTQLLRTRRDPSPPSSPLPSPSRTPAELIKLTQDLIQHRTDDSLLTLYNLHGPITNRTNESFHQFKTCNCNSLNAAWNFQSSSPAPLTQTPEGLETSIPIKLKNQNPRRLIIKLRFQRTGPLAGCWLLDGLYCFHPPRNTS